jgi:AcrR family transcriptional regulator
MACHRKSLTMAKPLIPVEVIHEHALALVDAEGAQALNARRLASDLKCSTRTLYQQVGNREELIRALVGRHFSQLQLDFHEYDT